MIIHRTISKDCKDYIVWVYEVYILDTLDRLAAFKDARHIRTITCRDLATFTLLTSTDCKNIIEINSNHIAKWLADRQTILACALC